MYRLLYTRIFDKTFLYHYYDDDDDGDYYDVDNDGMIMTIITI